MALHRISRVDLAVPDVAASSAFFTEFGLRPVGDGRFATRDGGEQVVLTPSRHRGLRELVLAAEDTDDLDRVGSALAAAGLAVDRSGGGLVVDEPATGVRVRLEVAGPIEAPTPPDDRRNAPGRIARRDEPAAPVVADDPVRPSNLTHLVLGTPDLEASLRFFRDLLGFRISDEVPGVIAFTRCGEVHHQVALQQAPGTLLHHVAFEVDGVDDVARGGTRLIDADAGRHLWGLGRHAIGSNWFWYLREPGGHFVEYAADIDRVGAQEDYRPGDWSGHDVLYAFGPPPPLEFLEPADAAEILAAQAG